jgi:hypothetical protein
MRRDVDATETQSVKGCGTRLLLLHKMNPTCTKVRQTEQYKQGVDQKNKQNKKQTENKRFNNLRL